MISEAVMDCLWATCTQRSSHVQGRTREKGELKMADCKDGFALYFLIHTKIKYKTSLAIFKLKWYKPWDWEHQQMCIPVHALHSCLPCTLTSHHTHMQKDCCTHSCFTLHAWPPQQHRQVAILCPARLRLPIILLTFNYYLCHISSSKPI